MHGHVKILLPMLLALASCQSPPTKAPPGPAATVAPVPRVTGAARRFSIDAEHSIIIVRVYRAGAFASLGHNHIIALRGLTGEILQREPVERSSVSINIPVGEITVDDSELRAVEGEDFAASIPESARVGTRGNLRGDGVLDMAQYPNIVVRSSTIAQQGEVLRISATVEIRGQSRTIEVPITLKRNGGQLLATGELLLTQSALGLKPFSVMLGALQVADEMSLHFLLTARPQAGAPG